MAYSPTVTTEDRVIRGRLHRVTTVVERGVTGASDEWTCEGPPSGIGTLTIHVCTLATGGSGVTATTVDPQMGEATGASSIWANASATSSTRNAPDARFLGWTLYGRSGANGDIGSTGTITTRIVWTEGHDLP